MPRQGLNRQKVLEAALRIVDEHGLEQLTMRRLGDELGVEAPSLYKHVGGKPEILDGITELIYDEVDFIDASETFRDRVHAYSAAFRRVLLHHPNAVELLAMRPITGEGTIALVEKALEEMKALGLEAVEGRKYLNVAVCFMIGHALAEVGAGQADFQEVVAARRQLDPDRYPNVAVSLADSPIEHDVEFRLGIDMVVDGIERATFDADQVKSVGVRGGEHS